METTITEFGLGFRINEVQVIRVYKDIGRASMRRIVRISVY